MTLSGSSLHIYLHAILLTFGIVGGRVCHTMARVSSPRLQLLGEMPEQAVWSQLRYQEAVDRGGLHTCYASLPVQRVPGGWCSPYLRHCASESTLKRRPQTVQGRHVARQLQPRPFHTSFVRTSPLGAPYSYLEQPFMEPKSPDVWHLIAAAPCAAARQQLSSSTSCSELLKSPLSASTSTIGGHPPPSPPSRIRYFTGLEKPSPAPLPQRLALAQRLLYH